MSTVKKMDGKQQTAANVHEAVFEILHTEGPDEKTPSRSERRSELVIRLKSVISERKSWEQVAQLMAELEDLL